MVEPMDSRNVLLDLRLVTTILPSLRILDRRENGYTVSSKSVSALDLSISPRICLVYTDLAPFY